MLSDHSTVDKKRRFEDSSATTSDSDEVELGVESKLVRLHSSQEVWDVQVV